jgi:hypothetical protein
MTGKRASEKETLGAPSILYWKKWESARKLLKQNPPPDLVALIVLVYLIP